MVSIQIKILFIFFILFSLYLIFTNYNKIQNQENFYTLFLPYYKSNFKRLNINYKFDKNLKIGYIDQSNQIIINEFINLFSKLLVANFNIEDLTTVNYKVTKNLLVDLDNNKINFAILPTTPLVNEYLNNRYNNVEFLSGIFYEYFFMITLKVNNYTMINDLEETNIGVLSNTQSELFLENINETQELGFNIITAKSIGNLVRMLNENKIKGIFLVDNIPSSLLNEIILGDFEKTLAIIPIEFRDDSNFMNKNYFIEPAFINLNLLPQNYLPIRIGNENYHQFNPILRTYKVHNFILVNKKMDKELIFKITRLLFQNKKIFNRLTLFETDKISPSNLLSKNLVDISDGTQDFYKSYGYITEDNNENCLLTVGGLPCNKTTISMYKEII
jgi:TRAP-type uncharacterized transport system substrate-binding protein